jgi:long-chain acyl-CoA synthetase
LAKLDEIITKHLDELPSEPFIWWQKTWWARSAFLELVEACQERLASNGFKSGHRLALIMPNCPAFLAYTVAVWRLGGTIVPIDPKSGYVTLTKELQHADVFAAITYRGCAEIVPLISEDGIPCVISPLDAPCDDIDPRASEQEENGNAVIFYTSGITGEPKAVPLTHENLMSCIKASGEHVGTVTDDDVFLNALPDFNALGFVCGALIPLVTGARQAMLTNFIPTEKAMEAMREAEVTILPAVPTMLAFMVSAVMRGSAVPSSLRYILSGGDRLPQELSDKCRETFGVPVIEGYGLTEASSVVTIAPGIDKIKAGTVGTLLSSVEAQIRGEDGSVLPAGSEGQLWIRGASVAGSYYRNPELTAKRYVDGWFDTQDIARFDDDGYMSLVARSSEIIFVGGFKVYEQEVERVLLEHPAVAQAAVVGVPRSISGEVVKAFVVLKKGEKATAKDLIESCRQKLAYYKVPRIIEFVPSMPRSSIGEILKRKLAEE